ncbi:MAG: hypothetical protein Ct9H90mP2_13050 [Dehalococcoidia bacterium]|nr:MAG: hypothetical protein Ct9H90mP2_13050 [Dehalococcoidia bacterium]
MKEFTEIPKTAMVYFLHILMMQKIGTGANSSKMGFKRKQKLYMYLLPTGSSGSNDTSMTSEKIVDIRSNEQIEAANAIGVEDIVSLSYVDGELESNRSLFI